MTDSRLNLVDYLNQFFLLKNLKIDLPSAQNYRKQTWLLQYGLLVFARNVLD